jgi:hypothetical protein
MRRFRSLQIARPDGPMPCIAQLPGGIKICMYYRDHNPPHFHAIQGDDEAWFRIADLGIERGGLSAAAEKDVRTWAATRQPGLALNWVLAIGSLQMRNMP